LDIATGQTTRLVRDTPAKSRWTTLPGATVRQAVEVDDVRIVVYPGCLPFDRQTPIPPPSIA